MPVDPAVPRSLDPTVRMAERLADVERQLRALAGYLQGGAVQQVPVVDSLPAGVREGRWVKLRGGLLYVDEGGSWRAV